MLLLELLITFQVIGVSRGNIYVFDSQKDYLRKEDSSHILLSKVFYNACDARFDYLWLYILTQEGLWSLNPLNGEVVSFYPLKGNFYKFCKDKRGNFYFLERGTQRLKVINFSRRDSFYLSFLPSLEVKSLEILNDKLYFLSSKGLFETDLRNFNLKTLMEGNFDRFKIFDSFYILLRNGCIFLKGKNYNEICINFEILDFTLFNDTLFVLTADSILKFPLKDIYR